MQCQVATGRSNDHLEMVTSYGRRRRRRSIVTDVDQAEKGDILSMTMLSKSLLIRPHGSDITTKTPQWDSELSSKQTTRHKSTAGNPNTHHAKEKLRSKMRPLGTTSDSKKSHLALSSFRFLSSDKDFICFEPINLLLICALSFCVQGIVFSLLFYVLLRSKSVSCQPRPVPSSQPNSHLYSIGQSYSFMR